MTCGKVGETRRLPSMKMIALTALLVFASASTSLSMTGNGSELETWECANIHAAIEREGSRFYEWEQRLKFIDNEMREPIKMSTAIRNNNEIIDIIKKEIESYLEVENLYRSAVANRCLDNTNAKNYIHMLEEQRSYRSTKLAHDEKELKELQSYQKKQRDQDPLVDLSAIRCQGSGKRSSCKH
jgi:hypothetical protein